MTRPPTRSLLQPSQPDALDDLEELGDDAIIAQQTEAHAPRPRANVSEESRSVVITDHPQRRDTEPPRGSSLPRSNAEPTLVIRDRRALDELRKEIVLRQAKKRRGNRALYLWGGLGLVAFVLGGVVAFLATDSASEGVQSANGSSGRVEGQAPGPRVNDAPLPAKAASPPTDVPRAVRLDDLPVEPKHKH